MKRRHIHLHNDKTADIGRSTEELLKIVKDPSMSEKDAGAAIQLLASRGIDPRTGAHVGMLKAQKIANEMGDKASG